MALGRLPSAVPAVAVVHYPPLGTGLEPTRASSLIEASGVHHCVFGHLHALAPRTTHPLFGPARGVTYWLTSCDYLDFTPLRIF
jgi:predicted phosphohydrolase